MSVIAFPKILTDRLTDEGARALADILNTVENAAQKITLEIAEERFEKKLSQLEARMDVNLAQMETRLIRWMFIFWMGQSATTLGILFAFFKH